MIAAAGPLERALHRQGSRREAHQESEDDIPRRTARHWGHREQRVKDGLLAVIEAGARAVIPADSIVEARRDQMFPVLAPAEIARLRRFGELRSYRAGEAL